MSIFMPIDAFSVSCAQLTRDLLAIAKFLFLLRVSILTRDIDIANLSVCLSIKFRYQMKTAEHVVIVFSQPSIYIDG